MRLADELDKLVDAERRRGDILRRAAPSSGPIPPTNPTYDTTTDLSIRRAEEQYRHNRGRFNSAVQVAARRIVGTPFFVARVNRRVSRMRSVAHAMRKGRLSQLPDFLKAYDPDKLELIEGHPLQELIDDPNEYFTRWELLNVTVQNLYVTGMAHWLMSREQGQWKITWTPTTWMTPVHTPKPYASWKVRPPRSMDEPIPWPAEYVVHMRFPEPADPFGILSPMQAQAQAVLVDEAIITAQHSGFQNGLMPMHAIIAGDAGIGDGRQVKFTDTQRRELISWIRREYQGVRKHGLPIILDALIKDVKQLSTKPIEMAFLDSSNLMESQIFMGMGINPISAGKVEDVNRASSALADHHILSSTVNPILEMFSQVITKTLAPLFSSRGEKLKAWFQPCYPHDPQLLIQLLKLLMNYRSVTRNEARRISSVLFNLPDWENGDTVPVPVSEQFFGEEARKRFENGLAANRNGSR